MSDFIPTGNEYVSLSDIRQTDGAILGLSILHMGYKGLIEVRGDDKKSPLFTPYVQHGEDSLAFHELQWSIQNHWIPTFRIDGELASIDGIILAPIDERGFLYRLSVHNKGAASQRFTIGLRGVWKKALHEINESKEFSADKHAYTSNWNHSVVFDLQKETAIFAFAPMFSNDMQEVYQIERDGSISFDFHTTVEIAALGDASVDFYWGIGFEEVSAATSAKEMKRRGFAYELDKTQRWLQAREKQISDEHLNTILNRNMFFNFFFASGKTLDTEELVLVTSRSARYYVSAAYWDRDSLLWSFPSILMVDHAYAREMLLYVFTRQAKNFGMHSRYIDGTLLEPGFELDELCAPVIALYNYVKATGDYAILTAAHIANGIESILKRLASMKHEQICLYETFLQPTDDEIVYPYISYDNVLVWRLFLNLSELYADIWGIDKISELQNLAVEVKQAIYTHCVKNYNGKDIFAWSVDLVGNWDVYDEPPGSLQLLPHYGFCNMDLEVYRNTVDVIRDPAYAFSFSNSPIAEIGCPHAPHPWVLSIANSLLCGRIEHCWDILSKTKLDNGIACESVDENTGICTTGEAFATCAGFLAYAINEAFSKEYCYGSADC